MKIRDLFDPGKNIYRTIEKVISYGASQETRLKAEISEYVVTESIEEQTRKLLDRMQLAMEAGGENEVGVWVSGFYGSGKSSFTKYFGLAFDSQVTVDGISFIKHLQDRLHTPQVKAQLAAVAQRFPSAVVMLDLASEMLAGATMEDVSTVLYYKVLQWAGYSQNLKVAALERKLEKDGRHPEFVSKVESALPGVTWRDLQNDPLAVDALIPQIAHDMYPALFPTPGSFSSNIEDFFKFEDERVREMIDLVREKSGKEYIIFVVDEVGQYIASRDNLILNLDGLAKNLKRLGNGKVWIISTAQQTLTEDDPRAALNSGKLYKLKDRFPIHVNLESHDIKEICYRRLLGKSPDGEAALGQLFDAHGQALRHNTRLYDAKYYDSDFSRETFINLYPFLPAHFEILLRLLGALAKSTGGLGLRSAIKVVQDILVEGGDGRSPVADRPVGWLATTVTLYDALEREIGRASSATESIHRAVDTTCVLYHDSRLHEEVAKSIAVLQIVGTLPVNAQNLAALMHPSVDHPSRIEEVRRAVEEMLNDPKVPLGEKDGDLGFLSEKLRDVEQERGQIPLRPVDTRRIFNEALRATFDPLPRTMLHNTLTVASGLKIQSGGATTGLAGESNAVQTIVEFVAATDYEAARAKALDESRQRMGQNTLYLFGRSTAEADELTSEIYRCQRIEELHRNDPYQEIKEYCAAQRDRAAKLALQLQQKLRESLTHGSFVFRGEVTAVSALGQNLLEAAKNILADAAARVYDRYEEAPERVTTNVAERFLRLGNLTSVSNELDPLGLVEAVGGTPRIKTDHKAVVSIRDYVDRNGTIEGKRLLEHFGQPPFGWSNDTVRYVLAAMLTAGEIKLKVSGREVTTPGQQAIDALKTNKSFGAVGVAMRDERPSIETLARAAQRLTDLTGETVIPLEPDITKAAVKSFPRFQQEYAPMSEKLAALELAGVERLRSLNREIADVLFTDASDAPQRLGGEESSLCAGLKWAGEVKRALENGLEGTVRQLQSHRREVEGLPDSGIPGELRRELAEEMDLLARRLGTEDFYRHAADLNSLLTNVKARVRDAARKLGEQQALRLKQGAEDLQRIPEWDELTQEERGNVLSVLDELALTVPQDLSGLRQLITRDYDVNTRLIELREKVRQQAQERRLKRLEEEREKSGEARPQKLVRTLKMSASLITAEQIDDLIRQLQEIRAQLALYGEVEVSITIEGQE